MTDANNTAADLTTATDDGLAWLDELAAEVEAGETAEEQAEREAAEAEAKAAEAALLKAERIAAIESGAVIRAWSGADACPRCSGRGKLNGYEHVCNGVCFRCGGSGMR